jgi:hypothetical protein
MSYHIESEPSIELVEQIAHFVDPVLMVVKEGNNLCSIQYPGIGEKVWVKVFYRDSDTLYQIFKNRLKDAKPLHLDQINPVKKDYLLKVLHEYVADVGHPHVA